MPYDDDSNLTGLSEVADRETSPNGRPRILIVDDEPRILRSLQAVLKSKFDIFLAEEANQAEQILAESGLIDVILSDECMPRCTGLELLQWTRQIYPDSVRILLSSTDFSAKREAIRAADVYRCIPKPWDTQELVEVLGRAVTMRRWKIKDHGRTQSERRSGISRHRSLVILDHDVKYREAYKLVLAEIADLSEIYFPNSAEEISRDMGYVTNIGIVVIDLAIGEGMASELIRSINQHHPRVMIIVTSDPASIQNFIPMVVGHPVYNFLAKPVSARRIQPVVADALKQHFMKMRK